MGGTCREARSWAGVAASPAPAPPAEKDCRRNGAGLLRTTQGVGVRKPQGQAGSSGASDSKLRSGGLEDAHTPECGAERISEPRWSFPAGRRQGAP